MLPGGKGRARDQEEDDESFRLVGRDVPGKD